jgi:hypothetical protein
MIPSYNESLVENEELLYKVREWTSETLGLPKIGRNYKQEAGKV